MSKTSHKRKEAGSIPAIATKPKLSITEFTYGEEYNPRLQTVQVYIQYRNKDQWAVSDGSGNVYNKDGEWEHEPLPSGRTEEFIERTRYPQHEALRLAEKAYAELRNHYDEIAKTRY